jgi:hypothetical protein
MASERGHDERCEIRDRSPVALRDDETPGCRRRPAVPSRRDGAADRECFMQSLLRRVTMAGFSAVDSE